MKKLLKIAMVGVLALGFSTTVVNADIAKGQKIFIKKYKKSCGFNGGVMAKKHSQAEWKKIFDEGKLNEEIITQCPNGKEIQEKYLQHLYDFFFNYANDSGNVPAC